MQGSRQFKDIEDYLVAPERFASLKPSSELPLAMATDCDQYLGERLERLQAQLTTANRMAAANELPDHSRRTDTTFYYLNDFNVLKSRPGIIHPWARAVSFDGLLTISKTRATNSFHFWGMPAMPRRRK